MDTRQQNGQAWGKFPTLLTIFLPVTGLLTGEARLRGVADVSRHLVALDTRLATVRTQHAEVGTRHAQILSSQEVNVEKSVSLKAQRASVEDVDLAR